MCLYAHNRLFCPPNCSDHPRSHVARRLPDVIGEVGVMKSLVVSTIIAVAVSAATSDARLNAAGAGDPAASTTRQTPPQAAPADRQKLTVRVTPLVRFVRGDARGMAIVPRHADNRLLRVILESADYYRLSELPLEGEDAPLTHPLYWQDLPPGSYCVTVQVYGATGLRGSTSIGNTQLSGPDR